MELGVGLDAFSRQRHNGLSDWHSPSYVVYTLQDERASTSLVIESHKAIEHDSVVGFGATVLVEDGSSRAFRHCPGDIESPTVLGEDIVSRVVSAV